MTDKSIDVQALREAHSKTTAGEWVYDDCGYITAQDDQVMVAEMRGYGSGQPQAANADFIVLSHNQMPAIVKEIEELRQAQQWQPIGTAPRDETPILVVALFRGERIQLVGYLDADGIFSASVGYFQYDVTHWMPLPTPPAKDVTK
jgi:hypothetical protein